MAEQNAGCDAARRPIVGLTCAVVSGRPRSESSGGTAATARSAVAAAGAARGGWAAATGYQRGTAMYRLARTIEARRDGFLAAAVPAELVEAAVERFLWYAGWADNTDALHATGFGQTQDLGGSARDCFTRPLGVACVIAASRQPVLAIVDKLGPALVAGNTVIVVTGDEYPAQVSTLCDALVAADLPPGVVNLVSGDLPALAGTVAADRTVAVVDHSGIEDPLVPQAVLAALRSRSLDHDAELPVLIGDPDHTWTDEPDPSRILPFFTTKTMWYTIGT